MYAPLTLPSEWPIQYSTRLSLKAGSPGCAVFKLFEKNFLRSWLLTIHSSPALGGAFEFLAFFFGREGTS